MAAPFTKTHSKAEGEEDKNKSNNKCIEKSKSNVAQYPAWFSPDTGIYHSKYPSITLPSPPLIDVASFIFSHNHGQNRALIDSKSGFSISYSELFSLAKSIASGLDQMGVKKGDVILILLPNSIYFPIVLLGALSIGAIVSPMNPSSTFLEVKRQVLDCNASLVFAVGDKVDELATRLGEVNVIGVDSGSDSMFRKLISSDPTKAPNPKISQKDTAAILYSSGTTGSSKGVMLTHGNFISMIEIFVRFEASQYDYPSERNVHLAVLPMFHVYGLSLFGLGLLSLGGAIVIMKKFDADEMVKVIERYGVTHVPAVPPLVAALTKKARGGDREYFRSLKQVACGAAPLNARWIEEFKETLPHVDFIQGYGLTESTAVGTRGYNNTNCNKHFSVGLLSPNVQAKVVDWVTSSYMPPGCVGELWLRSPGTMKGYLNNIDATMAAVDKDGWLHTGDIIYFDREGYLYVIDRLKEVIKYKGFQIAPADLEAVLMSHPEVLDAAVTAARDEESGDIPVAFVVPKGGSSITREALIDYVANQVAPYKKVRRLYFRMSIPRSPAGKILRRELRSLLNSKI